MITAFVVVVRARRLVERVMIDSRGSIVDGRYQGGNGDVLSRETVAAAEKLARALADLDAALDLET